MHIRQIHARLKMRSYAAEVFWAVLPRKSFLKLKARSRAPEFAYIHALPASYKHATVVTCAVGIDRIYTKATRKRVMSKRFRVHYIESFSRRFCPKRHKRERTVKLRAIETPCNKAKQNRLRHSQ